MLIIIEGSTVKEGSSKGGRIIICFNGLRYHLAVSKVSPGSE